MRSNQSTNPIATNRNSSAGPPFGLPRKKVPWTPCQERSVQQQRANSVRKNARNYANNYASNGVTTPNSKL